MIIIPYKTDSAITRVPVVNFILTASVLTASILFYLGTVTTLFVSLVLVSKWNLSTAFTGILVQPDLLTIIFIIIFLLLLGNALNSVIGNLYFAIFLAAACLVTSVIHKFTSIIPAIGAHALISALAGASMALIPANKIIFSTDDSGEDSGISVSFVVLLWIVFDAYAIINYPSISGLWANLGGLIFGFIFIFLLKTFKLIFPVDPVFSEWLSDRVALITNSELIASIMPGSRKRIADAEIRMKADRMIELLSPHSEFIPDADEAAPAVKKQKTEDVKFRILRPVKMKDYTTLYFVYEGAPVTGISMHSDYYKCEIYPSEALNPGDSGSIKVYSSSAVKMDFIYLKLECTLNGNNISKEMKFSTSTNQIKNEN